MKSYGVTIQMKPLRQYFQMELFIEYVVLTFESVDKILWCDHSNETSSVALSHGAIYLICSPNFSVSGRNPMVAPLKQNLSSSSFIWRYSFCTMYVNLTFESVDEILWCQGRIQDFF